MSWSLSRRVMCDTCVRCWTKDEEERGVRHRHAGVRTLRARRIAYASLSTRTKSASPRRDGIGPCTAQAFSWLCMHICQSRELHFLFQIYCTGEPGGGEARAAEGIGGKGAEGRGGFRYIQHHLQVPLGGKEGRIGGGGGEGWDCALFWRGVVEGGVFFIGNGVLWQGVWVGFFSIPET
ncbi:hypothetical protein GGR52DRAFT_487236 [Hypoxylon sp. FL1284]|nr:hypothetical protein GGR52DRAFT_487236 [Hypoxylon sp. FL1284]